MNKVKLDKIIFGDSALPFIGGPCVIESRDHCLGIAEKITEITSKLNIPFIFKSSFDKANRTSISSFRGDGLDTGLRILEEIKNNFNIPVTTDIHLPEHANAVCDVVDIIQIPAFLCRQTDLLVEAAKTGKVVNVKKGQFLSPYKVENIIKKLEESGNKNILITERGNTFGYDSLVTDLKSIPIMQAFGYPVILMPHIVHKYLEIMNQKQVVIGNSFQTKHLLLFHQVQMAFSWKFMMTSIMH